MSTHPSFTAFSEVWGGNGLSGETQTSPGLSHHLARCFQVSGETEIFHHVLGVPQVSSWWAIPRTPCQVALPYLPEPPQLAPLDAVALVTGQSKSNKKSYDAPPWSQAPKLGLKCLMARSLPTGPCSETATTGCRVPERCKSRHSYFVLRAATHLTRCYTRGNINLPIV